MIRFNALLRDEGVDPAEVKLARHQQDTPESGRQALYHLWRADAGRFELYQRIQGRPSFANARILAAFVATPLDETLFVGLYEIGEVRKAPSGTLDPLSNKDVSGYHFYELALSRELGDYRGRLILNWGTGFRSWVQWAARNDKEVIEISRTANDPPFPGFLDFRERLSKLKFIPVAWRTALAAVQGIYLLTCLRTGKQYVGMAHGPGGFWARWEQYAASGHGGNKRMIDIPKSDYQVSVIEVANSSASVDGLGRMESRWKDKLLSREFGLNGN